MKIMKSALMLSLIASLLVSALAMAPVSAPAVAYLKAPQVVNPLMAPTSSFTIDILVNNVVGLDQAAIYLAYNPSIITATYAAYVLASPVIFETDYVSLDNTNGLVTLLGHRRVGASPASLNIPGPGVPGQLPLAFIVFKVEARGTCPLDLQNTVLKNKAGELIPHDEIDGLFDNRFEGELIAPHIIDETLIPGSYFDVYIYVDDFTKLWGWQAILSFDPTYLEAVDCEYLPPMLTTWTMPPYEIGPDYVSMAASFQVGNPTGLTTTDPVAVARIGFNVLETGTTTLDLHDETLANVYGKRLFVDVIDGSFANVAPIIALETGFVETRKFIVSKEPDTLQTLTVQLMNKGNGTIACRGVLTVFDELDRVVATLITPVEHVANGITARLSVDLDVTTLTMPASYDVKFEAQYVDTMGKWVTANKGMTGANRFEMWKSFTLEP